MSDVLARMWKKFRMPTNTYRAGRISETCKGSHGRETPQKLDKTFGGPERNCDPEKRGAVACVSQGCVCALLVLILRWLALGVVRPHALRVRCPAYRWRLWS